MAPRKPRPDPTRLNAQAVIRTLYPELLEAKIRELCAPCRHRAEHLHVQDTPACTEALLPVTLEGNDCPYFQASPFHPKGGPPDAT